MIEERLVPRSPTVGERHRSRGPQRRGAGTGGRTRRDGRTPGSAWFRFIDPRHLKRAMSVMAGPRSDRILVLDRSAGRVWPLLGSDHAWLWSGAATEGGGPQLELLRRLAHWMMGDQSRRGGRCGDRRRASLMSISPGRTLGSGRAMSRIHRARRHGLASCRSTEDRAGPLHGRWEGPRLGSTGSSRATTGKRSSAFGPAAPREFSRRPSRGATRARRPGWKPPVGGIVSVEEGFATTSAGPRGASRPRGAGWPSIPPRARGLYMTA